MQPIQNSALRIATGAYRSSPVTSLHAETGVKLLEQYREIKMINYFLRLKAYHDSTLIEDLNLINRAIFDRNPKKAKPFSLRIEETIEKYNINTRQLSMERITIEAPWIINNLTHCEDL